MSSVKKLAMPLILVASLAACMQAPSRDVQTAAAGAAIGAAAGAIIGGSGSDIAAGAIVGGTAGAVVAAQQ